MTRLEEEEDDTWSYVKEIEVTYIVRAREDKNDPESPVLLSQETKTMWPTTLGHIAQKLYDNDVIKATYNGLIEDGDQDDLVQVLVDHINAFFQRPQPDVQGPPPYEALVVNEQELLSLDADKTLQHLVEVLMFLDEPRATEPGGQ